MGSVWRRRERAAPSSRSSISSITTCREKQNGQRKKIRRDFDPVYVSIATVVNKTAVPSMQIIFSLRPLCRKHEINHYEYESGLDFTTLHDNPSTPAAIASTSCTACQLNLSTSHQCCGSGSKLDAYRYLFNNFVDLDPCCEHGSANYIVYNLEKDFFQEWKGLKK